MNLMLGAESGGAVRCSAWLGFAILMVILVREGLLLQQCYREDREKKRQRDEDIGRQKQALRAVFESIGGSASRLSDEDLNSGCAKLIFSDVRLRRKKVHKPLDVARLNLRQNPITHFFRVVSRGEFFWRGAHKPNYN
jgi:hypothetical protein